MARKYNDREYSDKFINAGLYLLIAVFFLMCLRLYQMQILKGSEYRDAADSNRVRVMMLPAPRGIIYDRNGVPLVKNKPYYYASIMPGIKDVDTKGLAALLDMDEKKLLQKLKKDAKNLFDTTIIKEGLSFGDVARIEARRSEFPGLMIETSITRKYVYGNLGAHVIGYLGKPKKSQLDTDDSNDITPETFIGQWGSEYVYDKTLRGTAGKQIIEVDALGRQLKVLDYMQPETGSDVSLSIDINLQKVAEESFSDKTGSLVAIDPNTGEVLALVSLPSFDPNDFVMGIDSEKWMTLNKDKKHPLMNRALQSAYPPGSIFKPLVAIAGLEEGVITPDTNVFCRGQIEYGKWSFGCWKHHGNVQLHRAIVESCDVFFYEVGKRLGIDRIAKYAGMFGLGKATGLGLSGSQERVGTIPSTGWKLKRFRKPWFLGETFNSSIGQGYVAITPIEAALMASIIGNEGKKIKVTMLKGGEDKARPDQLNLKHDTFSLVKQGLYGVVNERGGTGGAARSTITEISGKTGTAQVVHGRIKTERLKEELRDHAWFFAFAPQKNPQIAVAVLVEHGGHGGSAAAPIAKKVIETFMTSKNNPGNKASPGGNSDSGNKANSANKANSG
ncbi:MAG: penicillin-binding protein 2 [Nitrospirae bacterium]|nr:penicillin-binding protein 2 [Nitrospirota bacterium]